MHASGLLGTLLPLRPVLCYASLEASQLLFLCFFFYYQTVVISFVRFSFLVVENAHLSFLFKSKKTKNKNEQKCSFK